MLILLNLIRINKKGYNRCLLKRNNPNIFNRKKKSSILKSYIMSYVIIILYLN